MYYISGCAGDIYSVTDTKDNVTETYTKKQIYDIVVNQGIKIGGVTKTSDGGLYIPCKSEDFLTDFAKSISATLLQLKLAGFAGNYNSEISKKAQQFGVINEGRDITLDLERSAIILPNQNAMMQFDSKGNYRIVTECNKISVLDKNVSSYSKLGIKAFDYMYLEVGGKKYTLTELVDSIRRIYYDCNPSAIAYIGITPSNRMFKFIIYGSVYSVKFGTRKELLALRNKIFSMKSEQPMPFLSYVTDMNSDGNPDDLAIIKITEKKCRSYIKELKAKYKTLHDVYIT